MNYFEISVSQDYTGLLAMSGSVENRKLLFGFRVLNNEKKLLGLYTILPQGSLTSFPTHNQQDSAKADVE